MRTSGIKRLSNRIIAGSLALLLATPTSSITALAAETSFRGSDQANTQTATNFMLNESPDETTDSSQSTTSGTTPDTTPDSSQNTTSGTTPDETPDGSQNTTSGTTSDTTSDGSQNTTPDGTPDSSQGNTPDTSQDGNPNEEDLPGDETDLSDDETDLSDDEADLSDEIVEEDIAEDTTDEIDVVKELGVDENAKGSTSFSLERSGGIEISNLQISSPEAWTYRIDFDYYIPTGTDTSNLKLILLGSETDATINTDANTDSDINSNTDIDVSGWKQLECLQGSALQTSQEGSMKADYFNKNCNVRQETGETFGYQYYVIQIVDTSQDSVANNTDPSANTTDMSTDAFGDSSEESGQPQILAQSDVLDASSHKYDLGYVSKSNYSGIVFLDENGTQIDKLELHKGESKLVRVALVNKNGNIEPLDESTHEPETNSLKQNLLGYDTFWNCDWSICSYDAEQQVLNCDYYYKKDFYNNDISDSYMENPNPIRFAWTKEYILGLSNYITADALIPQVGDKEGYSYIKFHAADYGDTMFGEHTAVLPVRVLDAEESLEYQTPTAPTTYGKDEFTTDIEITETRKALTDRENLYYGFILESGAEPANGINTSIMRYVDFYEEREGMKPEEGDYLQWHRGDRSSPYFFDITEYSVSDIKYYDNSYKMYYFPYPMVTTPYEEQRVNEKIDTLIHGDITKEPLSKAYIEYQETHNKDAALEAIFKWITENVSGTVKGQKSDSNKRTIPLYHTAYSTLFINNGYDSKPGSGTCQAFALLFTRLTREFGIPSKIIMGIDANAHTYNIAEFDDGYWYYVDASAGKFKKTYTEFAKADEMSCFSDYYFVKNYKSKIKDYNVGDITYTVTNNKNGEKYESALISDAGEYIIDSISKLKVSDAEIPQYTISLTKDATLKNFGNASNPNFDGLDLAFAGYDEYKQHVTFDLNGHTLTIPGCNTPSEDEWLLDGYKGTVTLSVGIVTNGTIVVGNNVGLQLDGEAFDSSAYSLVSKLTVKGSGILDIRYRNHVASDCNFNSIGELYIRAGVRVDCELNVGKLWLNNVYWENEAGTDTYYRVGSAEPIIFSGNVKTKTLLTPEDSDETCNLTVKNFVVSEKTETDNALTFLVKGNLSFAGSTKIKVPMTVMIPRNGNNTISNPKLSFGGSIDVKNVNYTDPITIMPVKEISSDTVQAEEDIVYSAPEENNLADASKTENYISDVFRLGDNVASITGCKVSYFDTETRSERNGIPFSPSLVDKFMAIAKVEDVTLDYYSNILYIAIANIEVYSGDKDSQTNLLGTYSRWDQAIKDIDGAANSAAHYTIALLDDVNAMGPLKLPTYAASLTLRSAKTETTDDTDNIQNVALRYTQSLEPKYNVTVENIDMINQTVLNDAYIDGNYFSVNIGARTFTLRHSSMMVTSFIGVNNSTLILEDGSYLDATKEVSGIKTLIMSDSTIKTDTKINITNIVSNSPGNKLIYGGNNASNILTITGTISSDDDSYVDLDDDSYGPYVAIKTNAITIAPKTITYMKDGESVTVDTSRLTEKEKNGQHIANVNISSAEWLIAGVDTDNRPIPTYKSGNMVRYGEMENGVVLFSGDDGFAYSIESIYDTLAEALSRINSLANSNKFYKILISGSLDRATNSVGSTGSNANLSFPSRAKSILISGVESENSDEEPVVLYYRDTMSINCDVSFENLSLRSVNPATLNLGKYTMMLNNCHLLHGSVDGDVEEIKAVNGSGKAGASKLILNDTDLCLTNNLNNVGTVSVNRIDKQLASPDTVVLIEAGMNIGTLEMANNVMFETRGTTTITNVENHGGILVVSANVTKVTKDTATDKKGQISNVNPLLTIDGAVRNDVSEEGEDKKLILKLTQRVVRNNVASYEPINFSDEVPEEDGRLTETLKENGVNLAKALKVPSDCFAISDDNHPDNTALIVKSNGYVAYRKCDPNVRLSYQIASGQPVETYCATLSEAVTEINNLNTKRNYSIELTDQATKPAISGDGYQAPKSFTLPKSACVDSLYIGPLDEIGDTEADDVPVSIYFTGGISLTSNVVLDNIAWVQMVKSGTVYKASHELTSYPAAISFNAGGKALTVKDTVRFNTPVNFVGKNGSLTFDDDARIFTFSNNAYGSVNDIYGSISGFSTLNVTEKMSVLKYRTKVNGGLTGGGLQTNYLIISGSKNPTLMVEGNLTATNTTMATGDIVVKDVFDTVTKKFTGAKAEFTNLMISGTNVVTSTGTDDTAAVVNADKISITADREFVIKGTLTSTTNRASLVTRQRYNADKSKRTPYLDIRGTVLINDYGTNAGDDQGDRIEIELRHSNECWNADYCTAKGVYAEVSDGNAAVLLCGSPANTGMVFTTAKGSVEQFILSAANIDTFNGREQARFGADHPNGYILKKVSSKVYAYFADEIKIAVTKNTGNDGKLSEVPDESVMGFYPSLADAVAAIDALKDKNTAYALIVMQDLGTENAPISLKLPSYAKSVALVSHVEPSEDTMTYAVGASGAYQVYYNNRIDLKTPTVFRTLKMKGVVIKNKDSIPTPQDIAAAGNDLTLDHVLINVKSITGNGKSRLTLNSLNLEMAGNINNFQEVEIADDSDKVTVAGSFTANKLTFSEDDTLDVKGAVTVTDIENQGCGVLCVSKKASDRKTNLTVKGFVTNTNNNKLCINLALAPAAGKFTSAETIAELSLVKDAKYANKVILSDTKALAKLDKASIDSFKLTLSECDAAGEVSRVETFESTGNLVKVNKALYICDDSLTTYQVLLSYTDEGNVAHSYKCLDMTQAAKEIETIGNPDILYKIEPVVSDMDILDTDLTGDNNEASALKLPAGGKMKSLCINMGGNKLRYAGNITNTGDLSLENTVLYPVAIKNGVVVDADTAISSTATNIKINGVNEKRQGLTLRKVAMAVGEIGSSGLITKITGTNKVTDISIENSDLTVREGISSINSLTLQEANLVTGKNSTILTLVIHEPADASGTISGDVSDTSWKMLGATTIDNVECCNHNAYVATNLGKNNKPNLTISGRVTGTDKLGVSLLTMDATLTNPTCVTKYMRSDSDSRTMVLRAQNLLIAKQENADRFRPFVPESKQNIENWITYKDGQGYVKAAPKSDLKVKIEQYYDDSADSSVTYATCIYDAVKIIDNMNDKNASYIINLSGDNRTGAMGANDEVAYGGFVTPTKAKLVTFRGNATYSETQPDVDEDFPNDSTDYLIGNNCGATIYYTGSLGTNCNIAFENIALAEGTYDSSAKKYTLKDALSLSVKNYDVSFDSDSGSKRMKNSSVKTYGVGSAYVDFIFSKLDAGAAGSDTPGVSFEGNIYCAGNVKLKNLTLQNSAALIADGDVTVTGNIYVESGVSGTEVEICSGEAKKMSLCNIIGNSDSTLDLEYYYEKKYFADAKTLLTISGNILSKEGGDALSVNLRPYFYNERLDEDTGTYYYSYESASLKEMYELEVLDENKVRTGYCLANIPKAAMGMIHPQYSDILVEYNEDTGENEVIGILWKNLEGTPGNGSPLFPFFTFKWKNGLYVSSSLDLQVNVTGYSDPNYSQKTFEADYLSMVDAVNGINSNNRSDWYYKIVPLNNNIGIASMPSKAKEITIEGDSAEYVGYGTLLYFKGNKLTIGCNTVLDNIILMGGAESATSMGSNDDVPYSINLGRYSLTERNSNSIESSFGIYQSGKRTRITGTKGSSYICQYTEEYHSRADYGYLNIPANGFSGLTDLVFENNSSESLTFDVPGNISVDNLTVRNTTLKTNNLTATKSANLTNATVSAGSDATSDGKMKLGEVNISGSNKIVAKQNSKGLTQLEITGMINRSTGESEVSNENSGEADKLALGLKYNNNSGCVGLYSGLQLAVAPKASTEAITIAEEMSPLTTSAIYKSGKNLYYTDSQDTIEVKLAYGTHETNFVSFNDAVKDIDNLSLYKDPAAKNKEYMDYEIILNRDVNMATARSYTLASKVSNLTINGQGKTWDMPVQLTAKTNLTIKDIQVLIPGRITGGSKYALTLASGDLNCESISGFGRINLNTGTYMDVATDVNAAKLYLTNKGANELNQQRNITQLNVGRNLKTSCIYVDTDGQGKAVLSKNRTSNVTLNGEKVRVDGVYITRSIAGVGDSEPVLHIVENYGAAVGDKVLTDNYAQDSRSKLRMYRNDLSEETKMSFYIDGKNIYAGK